MEWHLSKYTLFHQPEGKNYIVAFNFVAGTVTTLQPNEILLLRNFKELDENDSILTYFKKRHLIINYDEFKLLKNIRVEANLGKKNITLTICPTLNCNFNCTYCFENHKPGYMSPKTENDIVLLAEKMIDTFNSNKLLVTWFGGEPLLGIDIIDSLSKKLIKLANDKKIKYSASIITNGYLLNQKNADILFNNKVNTYQITLDGLGETHDLTRHLTNGQGTFNIIAENLRTVKINGRINIRHNIYEKNKNEIDLLKKLVKILAKQSGNKIGYYPAIVANNSINSFENQTDYLNDDKIFEICLNRLTNYFSRCKSSYCGSQRLYQLTIDNNGNLYKCWEDVDKIERSFGHVTKWNPKDPFFTADNIDVLTNYLNLSSVPEYDEECVNCIWLPFCMGGCPSKHLYFHKRCPLNIENTDKFLEQLAKAKLKI